VPIGLTGKRKKVNDNIEDVFELHINGSFEASKARLGKIYGDILANELPEFFYELAVLIENKEVSFYEFIEKNEIWHLGIVCRLIPDQGFESLPLSQRQAAAPNSHNYICKCGLVLCRV
jgi:hypothetical protein